MVMVKKSLRCAKKYGTTSLKNECARMKSLEVIAVKDVYK
jgi:hypothetical protein